jgi:acetolactate synthase-1/2/3 large subunit
MVMEVFKLIFKNYKRWFQIKLPIKIIVLNNNGYGIIKQFQELYLQKRHEASKKGVTNPNFLKIAKAYGINYNHN